MPELKEIPSSSTPTMKPVYKKRTEQEFTKFHMSFYDMERMDKGLIDVHSFLLKAEMDGTWMDIKAAYVGMKHAFVIFKYAYHRESREYYARKLMDLDVLIRKIEMETPVNSTIPTEIVRKVIDLLWVVFDGIYAAKQEVGLGIPKQKYVGVEARIRRAMRS